MPIEAASRWSRIRILMICCLSLFVVGVDITIVNVALPTIGERLDSDLGGLQWIVDSYTVVMASLLLFSGSMADRFGRRRVFVSGMALFAGASLLCSLATNTEQLIVFRMLQGAGASMLNPVAMSIITNTFTDPRERAQAVGVWGAVFGIAMALGPIVGGALVSAVGWPAIFAINVPIGAVAIALTLRFIPESKAPHARRFDPAGQVSVFALLASITFAIIEAPRLGWTSPAVLGAFALSAVALTVLLTVEGQRAEPLIDLRFFRSTPFASAIGISLAAFAAFGGFLFLNTLYLQEVRGLSALSAGLATAPMALMTVVASPISGRLVGRHGPRVPLVIAGIGLSLGSAMLLATSGGSPMAILLSAYAVFGLGFGFVNAPITNTAVSGMPRAQAGVAAAVATSSRQVGQTLGVAVFGAIASSHVHATGIGGLADSAPKAWWLLSALGLLVLALGLYSTTARAGDSARRTAEALNPEALAA